MEGTQLMIHLKIGRVRGPGNSPVASLKDIMNKYQIIV
ncbi:hypothetical protein JOC85_000820 [Bacillus mesophilus]|nr:hypothetical protein [Bacillus mesophilus]